ncbi:hypothetical protein BX600DRAFT_511249 [Xylariales sp. PMI_506]|nr:hypothetical protein BX600DRAFT_511249 [Xylariales sp. PMI_506]
MSFTATLPGGAVGGTMLIRPQSTRCLCRILPRIGSRSVVQQQRNNSSGVSRRPPPPSSSAPRRTSKPLPYKPSTPPSRSPSSPSSPTPSAPVQDPLYTPPPKEVSVSELVRTRWVGLFGAGAATLCLGFFAASFLWANSGEAPRYVTGQEPCVPTGRPSIQSPVEFDLHLDKSEWRYGITKLRRGLAAEATGHVLEVAVGSGRNLEFYDWGGVTTALLTTTAERNRTRLERSGWGARGIDDANELTSFTGVDVNEEMLDLGLRRMRLVVPHAADLIPEKSTFAKLSSALPHDRDSSGGTPAVHLLGDRIRLFKADAQDGLPPPPPSGAAKYDTIVETFGLCSVRDPVQLLANMAAQLAPGTGRILLLEHGRSWWDLVNGVLDRAAGAHFERFGCWWNRDIEAVVREAEARVPGLEVLELRRPGWFKFGTHYWIELRVRPATPTESAAGHGGQASKEKAAGLGSSSSPPAAKADGWLGWFGSSTLTVTKPKEAGDAKKD